MKKAYIYEQPFYGIEVVFTGVFCVCIALACIFCLVTGRFIPRGLCIVFGIAAIYQAWNTFISLSNPEKVIVDDEKNQLIFSGFGRNDSYTISDIKVFNVRPFPSSGKTFIRINNYRLTKGRYWVPTKMFSDGQELFNYLCDLDYRINPHSLKSRARDVNSEYIAHTDQIKKGKRNRK